MNEQGREVLNMLAAGQINADEAERLLNALGTAPSAVTGDATKPKPRYLRVVVDSEKQDRPTKVNVRVPLGLLRAGVKLSSLIPAEAMQEAESALKAEGITIGLSQIKPENIEEIVEGLSDMTVDVDDKEVRVKMFCE